MRILLPALRLPNVWARYEDASHSNTKTSELLHAFEGRFPKLAVELVLIPEKKPDQWTLYLLPIEGEKKRQVSLEVQRFILGVGIRLRRELRKIYRERGRET